MEPRRVKRRWKKMRWLVLRGVTRVKRSIQTPALGALLGIGSLQNIIRVQATKAYYRIYIAYGVKFEESGPKEHRSGRILWMSSERILRTYLFDNRN